jgi:hypothetical protein
VVDVSINRVEAGLGAAVQLVDVSTTPGEGISAGMGMSRRTVHPIARSGASIYMVKPAGTIARSRCASRPRARPAIVRPELRAGIGVLGYERMVDVLPAHEEAGLSSWLEQRIAAVATERRW